MSQGEGLPTSLPNPSRILLVALDKWAGHAPATQKEKLAVLHGLQLAVRDESVATLARVESIPYLIAAEDPDDARGPVLLPGPPLSDLLA